MLSTLQLTVAWSIVNPCHVEILVWHSFPLLTFSWLLGCLIVNSWMLTICCRDSDQESTTTEPKPPDMKTCRTQSEPIICLWTSKNWRCHISGRFFGTICFVVSNWYVATVWLEKLVSFRTFNSPPSKKPGMRRGATSSAWAIEIRDIVRQVLRMLLLSLEYKLQVHSNFNWSIDLQTSLSEIKVMLKSISKEKSSTFRCGLFLSQFQSACFLVYVFNTTQWS